MFNFQAYGENLNLFEDFRPLGLVTPLSSSFNSSISVIVKEFVAPSPKEWFEYSWKDGACLLQWQNIADFLISKNGSEVFVSPKIYYSKDVMYSYLLTQVIGFCLTLRGQEVLHSTGISFGGRNYFILGDSGVGKSTFAARVLTRGGKLITDDILVTRKDSRGKYFALRGFPRIKLYPDSIISSEVQLRDKIPLSPYTDKILGVVYDNNFISSELTEIDKLILLNSSENHNAGPVLRTLRGEQATLSLLHNTFNTLDRRPERLKNQFNFVADILRSHRVQEFSFARGMNRIDEAIDYLYSDECELKNEANV